MIFVLEHNLGKLDTKASDRVIIRVICLQNVENVTRNGSVILAARLSRDRDVAEMFRLQLFSSRLLLVTLGEAGVAGELNLEQSSPDRDLQNLTRQQSPAVWGNFFYKKKYKTLESNSC